jgi:hypothetical protein
MFLESTEYYYTKLAELKYKWLPSHQDASARPKAVNVDAN